MKIFTSLFFFFLSMVLSAQITIQHAHLPGANDTLITRSATFTSEFDPEETGNNMTWNVGFDILEPLIMNQDVICYDVNDSPIEYQFMFNNPFDPDHNSDYAIGVDQADVGGISFENAFQYFKNSNNVYSMTGMGASINGIPLVGQMNDTDVLYDIPLTFGTNGSSDSQMEFDIPTIGYYGLTQHRDYECDGWGTLNIWGLSFDVIRVRSVVNATDSVYTELFGNGFGFSFPRPEIITYEWLSTEYNVPILKITSTDGNITQVATADIYDDGTQVMSMIDPVISVYPNPCTDELRFTGLIVSGDLRIFAQDGRMVLQESNFSGRTIDVKQLAPGKYHATLIVDGVNHTIHFIKNAS